MSDPSRPDQPEAASRASYPIFAIVGHPNKGKSSIVATLAEDDAIAISAHPGTTTRARGFPMCLDGETLYELVDTPGFQRARETLAWLERHDQGAGRRADVVAEFVTSHANDPRFQDERELLTPIVNGAGILYVVDGSRPYGRQYEAEMEILRRTGRPRMALINLIAEGDHVDEWRAALSQFFSIVRVFDALEADFSKRIELLNAFAALDEQSGPKLRRAAEALSAERERRRMSAAGEIASLLTAVLTTTVTVPLPGREKDAEAEQRGRRELRTKVRAREQAERSSVLEIYHHAGLKARESESTSLAEDVFSAQSFNMFGLSGAQLAVTGAASGALAGGLVDVALGGASLLLGAGIGAAVGAVGVLAGADKLASIEILGQPLGGFELKVGPFADPNLPWVVLGRALLHVRLIAERNHSRREELVVDSAGGTHLADSIDAAARRRIDVLFRKLRSEQGLSNEDRARLVDEIAGLMPD